MVVIENFEFIWLTSINLLNNNSNKKVAKNKVTNEEETDNEKVQSIVFIACLQTYHDISPPLGCYQYK